MDIDYYIAVLDSEAAVPKFTRATDRAWFDWHRNKSAWTVKQLKKRVTEWMFGVDVILSLPIPITGPVSITAATDNSTEDTTMINDQPYRGKITIERSEDGQFYALYKGANHKVLAQSETMKRKRSVLNNIEAMAYLFDGHEPEIVDNTN